MTPFNQNKMILVMGLPGSGKTHTAQRLVREFKDNGFFCNWFNADDIRRKENDWDFSPSGRRRAAARMRTLVNNSIHICNIVDMVSPTPETRDIVKPDYIIWMDTIKEGRFDDTNQMFVPPENANYIMKEWYTQDDIKNIMTELYKLTEK